MTDAMSKMECKARKEARARIAMPTFSILSELQIIRSVMI